MLEGCVVVRAPEETAAGKGKENSRWGGVVASDPLSRDLQDKIRGVPMSVCRQRQGKGPALGVHLGRVAGVG